MSSGSKKIVVVGIVSNAIVTVLKFTSALIATSASMMNEAIHSLMDTLNQLQQKHPQVRSVTIEVGIYQP